MMRALYSGVSGMKTHQTKMDVIGNNIANVNTVAYKSMSITFTELMYQTTQKASGPNATLGTAGQNAKQIGLGSTTGAISTQITTQGATQTTGNPFDIKISGDAFFIVKNGNSGSNYFTRDGSFYVDANGNLAMASTGYNVMGWQVDDTTGDIRQDTVSALRIMNANNMTYEPEATTNAYVSGILDKNDSNVQSVNGKSMSLGFYDALGYQYTAKISIHSTTDEGVYYVVLDDVLDADNKSLTEVYGITDLSDIVKLGGADSKQSVSVNEVYASKYKSTIKSISAVELDDVSTNFPDIDDDLEALQEAINTYLNGDGTNLTTDQQDLLNTYYGGIGNGSILNALHAQYSTAYQNGYASLEVSTGTATKGNLKLKLGTVSEGTGTNAGYYTTSQLKDLYEIMTDTSITDYGAKFTTMGGNIANATTAANTTVSSDIGSALSKTGADIETEANAWIAEQGMQADAAGYQAYARHVLEELYPDVDFSQVQGGEIDEDGNFVITNKLVDGGLLTYDTDTGKFVGIATSGAARDTAILNFSDSITVNGEQVALNNFADIAIDFSPSKMYNNNKTSTIGMTKGDTDGLGTGRMLGTMEGVSIQTDGKIYASYTNGCTRLLGQIAVAEFANAAGLEKMGDNLYAATLNSGDFDGIGTDISADGGSMSTGTLEMSNVDLATEFTEMITTQRGYQANSRIITVSDTLLEELVNLKR